MDRLRSEALALVFVLGACREPVKPAPAIDAAAAPPVTAQTASAPAEPPPEEKCSYEWSTQEELKGWLLATNAAGRHGKFEMEGTITESAPSDCAGHGRSCLTVRVDGTRLLIADPFWKQDFAPGVRHRFSVLECDKTMLVRGYQILGRVTGAPMQCVSGENPPKPATKLEGWPQRKLVDLDRTKVSGGGFDTEGVVVWRFEPVGCPPGATCKPQPPPHITIADAKDREKKIVLMTPEPKTIPENATIKVSAIMCPHRGSSYGGTVNEGELRAWTQ